MAARETFVFGRYRLDVAGRVVFFDGAAVPLAPKQVDTLIVLVRAGGAVVDRDELMKQVWPDTFVEEAAISKSISALRKILEEHDASLTYIETLPKRGYRFVAPVAPDPEAAAPARRQRLIVLPFRMLKPDPDVDFLTFSLPDALTASLSTLDALTVRSSLIAARFAGDVDLQRVAREAQVDLIVSGTLVRAGTELRVSAQLADAAAGSVIWSHTAQGRIDDLFRLQDALVEKIIGSLSRPLSAPELRRLRHDVPATAKSYEFFLRANQASPASAFSIDRAVIARDLYLQAVAEDPGYAPAWARVARMYRMLGKYVVAEADANMTRADEALQRALSINPDLSIAHNLFAQIDVDRGRAEQAMVRLLERVRQAGPNAELFAGLVQACRFCGLLDASLAAHAHAQRLDPLLATSVMHTFFVLRRYDEVIAVSGDVKGYVYSLSLDALGRRADAVDNFKRHEQLAPKLADFFVSARALVEGRREESVEALTRAMPSLGDPEAFFYAARHFAHLGATAPALEALRKSVSGGYVPFRQLSDDPWLDSLRETGEFQALAGECRGRYESAEAAFRRADGLGILT